VPSSVPVARHNARARRARAPCGFLNQCHDTMQEKPLKSRDASSVAAASPFSKPKIFQSHRTAVQESVGVWRGPGSSSPSLLLNPCLAVFSGSGPVPLLPSKMSTL